MPDLMPIETIENKIYLIRGQKVMLDGDLAKLYGVKTKALNQAVKRNKRRFPQDFMFQLTKEESLKILQFKTAFSRSQIVTLKRGRNIKYAPNVFTEQGIAMLSSVLNSERAIEMNIAIMRVFVKLRQILSTHKKLAQKIKELELEFGKRFKKHDVEIQAIFRLIKQMLEQKKNPKPKIGFRPAQI